MRDHAIGKIRRRRRRRDVVTRQNEELRRLFDAAEAIDHFRQDAGAPEARVMKGGECKVCVTGEGGVGRMKLKNGVRVEENKRYEFVGFKIVSRDEDGVDFIFDNAKEVEECDHECCVYGARVSRIWGGGYAWGG